jgi:hypothetical protein
MRKMKRWAALLCAVLMAVTLLPTQVWATDGTDGGSAAALEEPIVSDKPAMSKETATDGQPADDQTPAPTDDETPDAEVPEESESADPQEPEQEVDNQDTDNTDDSDVLCRATLDPISHELEVEQFSAEEAADAEITSAELNNALTSNKSGSSYFDIISVTRYGRAKLAKMSRSTVYLKIYDRLLEMAENFTVDKVSLPTNQKITHDEAWLVTAAFYSDYPELFWARPSFWYNKNTMLCSEIQLNYNSHIYNLNTELPLFLETAETILAGMPTGSDYEKELYLHDALIKKVTYTYSKLEEQNGYTTLVEGKGVCAGYAFALQYLLMRAGIQSYYVVGYAGENHAWNLAKIDGEWYYVDATWDDPLTGSGSDSAYSPFHTYFNLSAEMMAEDHTLSGQPYNVPLEDCTATDAFYHNVNHTAVSTSDTDLVSKVADLLQRNSGIAHLYVTDSNPVMAAREWYYENIVSIARAMQVDGGYEYGYSYSGREIVLWFAGEFLSKTPGELNGSSGLDILDVELLYQYLTTGRPTITSVMTEAQFLDNADVNRDTIIDVYDLQLLYETVCNG